MNEEPGSPLHEVIVCGNCGTTSRPDATYCHHCGNLLRKRERMPNFYGHILKVVGYFMAIVLFWTFFQDMVGDSDSRLLILDLCFASMTGLVLLLEWKTMQPIFDFRKVKLNTLGKVLLIVVPGGVVVHFLGILINKTFHIVFLDYAEYFDSFGTPWLYALIFLCIHPAIVEEVAFRGLIYSWSRKFASPQGAIGLSAILFGLIHFSMISMLWILPLGLLFAWFRHKTGIIWYGVFGHFAYNGVVLLCEEVFPMMDYSNAYDYF